MLHPRKLFIPMSSQVPGLLGMHAEHWAYTKRKAAT